MDIVKGYKVKIYPNKTQAQILEQHIGACRYVYNHFLELRKKTYLENKKTLSYNVLSKQLTQLRRETPWMQEVRFDCLQQSLRALDTAYNRFFRKEARFPRFKSKKGTNTMRKVTGWRVNGNKLHIMRGIEVAFRGKFVPKRSGTLTISRDASGTWWVSTIQKETVETKESHGTIGIDLGLNYLAITSDGSKYDNVRVLNGLAPRIKSASQALSRTKEGSNRREKARLKLARLKRKESFIRKNHLHHVSKSIVGKNHAVIGLEDLSVKNMMKNRCLSRAIGDAGWGELIRQITYKQKNNGGKVVQIDRYFPSSKTCSVCNFVLDTLPLSVRIWTCGNCGTEHDRDINAAKMIKQQAAFQLGGESGEGSRKRKIARSMKRGDAN